MGDNSGEGEEVVSQRTFRSDVLVSIANLHHSSDLCSPEPSPLNDPPPKRWTTQDSNRTVFTVLSTTTPRKPALPTELILQILSDPSRWLLTTFVYLSVPARVPSSEAERAIVHTPQISSHQLSLIRRLVFTYRSKDQGWSSYGEDHGSYRNSWTWFEAGLRKFDRGEESLSLVDRPERRYRLQSNRHAGQEAEDYLFEFERDHPLLKEMQAGDEVVLWALARYGGWENFVEAAAIQIWITDDMDSV